METTLKPSSKHMDFQSILNYADMTNDDNPLHINKEFASKSPMGGIIAPGTMSVALIWQALKNSVGLDALNQVHMDIRFVRPVRIDDTVTGGGQLQSGSAHIFDVWVRNQDNEDVILGTASLKLP